MARREHERHHLSLDAGIQVDPETHSFGQRRVNDLVLGPIINRSRPNGDSNWATADNVGDVAVLLAASGVSAAQISL